MLVSQRSCCRILALRCLLSSPYSRVLIQVGEMPGDLQAWYVGSAWLQAWCDLCSRKGTELAGHYLRSTACVSGTVPAHCGTL